MKLTRILLGRLWQLLLISFLVTMATFLLSSLIPGDFFTLHQMDPTIQTGTLEALRQRYGLDKPVTLQYLLWLKNLVRLDLGYSLFYRAPVATVVAGAMIRTSCIGIPALILGFAAGLFFGTCHAAQRGNRLGRLMDLLSGAALALPSIILGLGALLLAARTGWFPLGSMSSAGLETSSPWRLAWDRVHHLLLPVACLTVPIFAAIERIHCSSVRQTAGELYVRAARSRGLAPARIFFQYLVRPSLNPVLANAGPMLGAVLSGSLVLETIFAWPGLGQITFDALFSRDIFLLLGCILGSSALLVVGNLIADILQMMLDPRVRASVQGTGGA